jgi:CheY-like chemotaxis protein
VTRSAVVLDTAAARATIVTTLRDGGFDVLETATVEEALEWAHRCRPDLIIANPLIDGIDTDEFTLALGVDPLIARTPVVFSASTDDAREVLCLAGASDVAHIMIKPCEPDEIIRFVGEILGSEPDVGPIVPAQPSRSEHV